MNKDTTASGAADLPEAPRSIQRFEVVDCIDEKHVPAVIPKPHGPWVRYEDHIAALAAGQATAAQPAAPKNLWLGALDIRMAQGWRLKGDRLPVLYTDTINGDGVCRDDLWLCTGEALKPVAEPAKSASRGQAPAGATLPDGWVPLTITHEGQYPEEVAYGPQIMMDRLGKWLGKYFAQAAESVPAPVPPPECETEAEKRAFAFGWFKALESERMKADSVQEDAARYRWLREGNDAKHGAAWHVAVNLYGCEWDAAIDAARAAQKGRG